MKANQTTTDSNIQTTPYLVVDEKTGEQIPFSPMYLVGSPKQYRFNGQVGQVFTGKNGDINYGKTITFQPIAWRLFEENLFGRGRKDQWAELFFIDDKKCVSAIMFNNTSFGVLMGVIEDLFYDGLSLADVVLTVSPEKKENDKGKYYAAQFAYVPAPVEQTQGLIQWALNAKIYRADTLTETAVYRLFSDTFFFPEKYRLALATNGNGPIVLEEFTEPI